MPNLANAPFRLLAIVNRMDLSLGEFVDAKTPLENAWTIRGRRDELVQMASLTGQESLFNPNSGGSGGYGGSGRGTTRELTREEKKAGPTTVGEGRLVFGAVDSEGRALQGGWTIIFEYALDGGRVSQLPGPEPSTALAWARAWHRLGEYELGDHRFNDMLAVVTRAFTTDEPRLKQMRSNEACFGPGRIFRQFIWSKDAVSSVDLPMTPSVFYMKDSPEGSRSLARFLRDTEPLIRAGLHAVPENDPRSKSSRDMLASHAIIPEGKTDFHWETNPPSSREARRIFSLSTCNGCHAAETNCASGLHIQPRNAGEASKLSDFLRMDGKPNRFQDPGLKTSYVKQQEMSDRAAILAALLNSREGRRLDALQDIQRDRLRRGH